MHAWRTGGREGRVTRFRKRFDLTFLDTFSSSLSHDIFTIRVPHTRVAKPVFLSFFFHFLKRHATYSRGLLCAFSRVFISLRWLACEQDFRARSDSGSAWEACSQAALTLDSKNYSTDYSHMCRSLSANSLRSCEEVLKWSQSSWPALAVTSSLVLSSQINNIDDGFCASTWCPGTWCVLYRVDPLCSHLFSLWCVFHASVWDKTG